MNEKTINTALSILTFCVVLFQAYISHKQTKILETQTNIAKISAKESFFIEYKKQENISYIKTITGFIKFNDVKPHLLYDIYVYSDVCETKTTPKKVQTYSANIGNFKLSKTEGDQNIEVNFSSFIDEAKNRESAINGVIKRDKMCIEIIPILYIEAEYINEVDQQTKKIYANMMSGYIFFKIPDDLDLKSCFIADSDSLALQKIQGDDCIKQKYYSSSNQ